MKILILVLSYNDNGIYSKFLKTQKETWDSEFVDGVETYYYFGNCDDNKIIGNNIHTKTPESLMFCGLKTLEAFKLILNMDFDFLFRTNSSSYVDKKLLKNVLKNKPKNNFYSGIIGNHDGIPFCSGAGYVISKDLVDLITKNEDKIDHSLIDDVSFAKFFNSNNIKQINSERFDVVDNVPIPLNYFHYRLKTENRETDINNMKLIFYQKCNLLQETNLN